MQSHNRRWFSNLPNLVKLRTHQAWSVNPPCPHPPKFGASSSFSQGTWQVTSGNPVEILILRFVYLNRFPEFCLLSLPWIFTESSLNLRWVNCLVLEIFFLAIFREIQSLNFSGRELNFVPKIGWMLSQKCSALIWWQTKSSLSLFYVLTNNLLKHQKQFNLLLTICFLIKRLVRALW